jgi:hypothetical protein
MSKYLLNKFLYTIDRDPELVERYRADPRGTVAWWEAEQANAILNCPGAERSTWLKFTDAEREALATHDYVTLFEMGAHNFLTLTLFIALFERDYAERALPRHRHLISPGLRHHRAARGAARGHGECRHTGGAARIHRPDWPKISFGKYRKDHAYSPGPRVPANRVNIAQPSQ